MRDIQDIYMEYADYVKRFLICLTGNGILAEDLTQETFYQAYKSINRYDGSCKMSVWLCQIAKHVYYDYLKKQKHYQTVSMEELVELSRELTARANIEEKMIQREQLKNVYDNILLLNETQQKVFILRIFGDLSFREIGEIFSKSENWARVTFYRAKLYISQKCREELGGQI